MNTIKVQVHLIATDKDYPSLGQLILSKGNNLLGQKGEYSVTDEMIPQHLYFTNSEEIKEGDWHINLLNNSIEKASKNVAANWKSNMSYNNETRFLRNDYKKIVATTNPELWGLHVEVKEAFYPFGIPKIPQSFISSYIKRYNENNSIKEVWLEQSNMDGIMSSVNKKYHTQLKLTPDGEVIVVPKEEKIYTREELIQACMDFRSAGGDIRNMRPLDKEWFDKNYPIN